MATRSSPTDGTPARAFSCRGPTGAGVDLSVPFDHATYCSRETWQPFDFELGFEYRPTAADELFLRALVALWRHPAITGPWPSREEYGRSIEITPDMLPRDSTLSLYGLLRLHDRRDAACSSFVVRPKVGSDLLSLHVPGGTLRRLFPVADNPMSVKRNPWLREIESLFAEIAVWVYGVAPFELAILGEHAAAMAVDAADLTGELLSTGGFILPDALWRRLNPALEARPLAHGLRHITLA